LGLRYDTIEKKLTSTKAMKTKRINVISDERADTTRIFLENSKNSPNIFLPLLMLSMKNIKVINRKTKIRIDPLLIRKLN
jgi:hypothetical protein